MRNGKMKSLIFHLKRKMGGHDCLFIVGINALEMNIDGLQTDLKCNFIPVMGEAWRGESSFGL